jgi:hypothetical protein
VSYGLHAECRVPLAYRKAGPTRGVMTYVDDLTGMSYRPEYLHVRDVVRMYFIGRIGKALMSFCVVSVYTRKLNSAA